MVTTSSPSTSSTPISATINEALRSNPFGSTSRSRALEAETQAASRTIDLRHRDLDDRNQSLFILAQLFPDVRIEVFRELLTRFDGTSRLHVSVEQLLKHKKQWVQGRWNIEKDGAEPAAPVGTVAPEEYFRSESYKGAVKAVLCKEFGGLSRSTIDGVLAEVNYSYTRARPTLKELSRKGWRATIINLNPFKRKKDSKDENPLVVWERSSGGDAAPSLVLPRLKHTGSDELDQEIHQTVIAPFLREHRETQEHQDYRFATEMNEKEAMAGNALYECQCCLDDVTFEQVSACSSEGHMICFNCIRRTLHEAIFGQGWDNSVDSERSTLKCVAPVSHGVCDGHLDPTLVKRAITSEKAGSETYRKFEDRVASEALLKTNLKLIRCPYCSYAEIDPIFHPSPLSSNGGEKKGSLQWRFRRDGTFASIVFTTILILDLIPLLFLPFLVLLLLYPHTATTLFHTSLQNLCLRSRSRRFHCDNPTCRQISCMTCHKPWRDPHTCEEPLQQSLRTTIEAARTAAVKRTCPRCNLSFVKSSGCNKLTCVCGYSMCYVCRKALNGPSSSPGRRRNAPRRGGENANNIFAFENEYADANEAEDAGQSGYKHFCEHFRVNPGTRCTECNKCELYYAEDEETIARRAGERAEREWRLRQSVIAGGTNQQNGKNNNASHNTTPYNNHNHNPINLTTATTATTMYYNYNYDRATWHYWLIDVWQEKDRWKWEVQGMADRLIERVVVVDLKY